MSLATGQYTHTEAMHIAYHISQNIHKHVQMSALGLPSMMLRCVIAKTVKAGRPYRHVQDRQLVRDKTCPART